MEFGAGHGAVAIKVRGPELPLHQGEILVLCQGAVVIAIRPAELGKAHATTTKLCSAELPGSMTIQLVE